MKNKIIQLLQSTAGMLIFALLSGCAYYIVVLKFILSHTSVGGGLLGFFFLPAIIFVFGAVIAFATGTSWVSFGILIPILVYVFS